MGKLFKIYLPNGPKMKYYHQLHEKQIKENINNCVDDKVFKVKSHKRSKLSCNKPNQLFEKYGNPNDELKSEENNELINNSENDINMSDNNIVKNKDSMNINDSDDGWSIDYSSSSEDDNDLFDKRSKNNNNKLTKVNIRDKDVEIKDKSSNQNLNTNLEIKNDEEEFDEEENDNIRVCAYCGTHITSDDYLVSSAFTGRTGSAYLYDRAFNVILGESGKRKFSTGVHYASDIYCILCGSNLGWTYFHAQADSQQYKIGCYCLEIKLLKKSCEYNRNNGVSVSLPFNYNSFIKKYKNTNYKKNLQLYQKLCQKSNNNNNNNESESGSPQHLSRPSVGSNISIENLDQEDDDDENEEEHVEENDEEEEEEEENESHTDEIMHDIEDDDQNEEEDVSNEQDNSELFEAN